MNKILCIFLCLAMCLSFFACSTPIPSETSTPNDTTDNHDATMPNGSATTQPAPQTVSVTGIEKTDEGSYTMHFSDSTSSNFTVTSGQRRISAKIESIEKVSDTASTDTYRITCSDGNSYMVDIPYTDGQSAKDRAIASIDMTESRVHHETQTLTETFTVLLVNGASSSFRIEYEIPDTDFTGLKMTFLGDSITYGVGASVREKTRYSTLLCKKLGLTEVNLGINGTVLCEGGHRTSRLPDIYKIPRNSDIVTILLGVNDFDQCKNDGQDLYYSLGTMESRDTETIYGALHAYCTLLQKRFNTEKTMIFFMTPVITSSNSSCTPDRSDWDPNKKNACGYSLRDLCDAIIEVCDYYGILCFDLNTESGLVSTDLPDGIHPSDSGTKKMADAIEKFIRAEYALR